MIIYRAINKVNGKAYIGLTRGTLSKRKASHLTASKSGSGTYFHNAIRKYGPDNFTWSVAVHCDGEESMKNLEVILIKYYKHIGCYNISDGGDAGYAIPEEKRDEWIRKLKIAREGKKPALGMKHTEENKKFFSECSKRRKLLYPDLDAVNSTFKDAHRETGISKTHFYRLRKSQAKFLDLT